MRRFSLQRLWRKTTSHSAYAIGFQKWSADCLQTANWPRTMELKSTKLHNSQKVKGISFRFWASQMCNLRVWENNYNVSIMWIFPNLFLFLFFLLSQESGRGATHMTNLEDPTRIEVTICSGWPFFQIHFLAFCSICCWNPPRMFDRGHRIAKAAPYIACIMRNSINLGKGKRR